MQIVTLLKQLEELVEMAKPLADIIGQGSVIKMADNAIEIATNVLNAYEQAQIVLASDDETYIREMITRMQAENDTLAQQIKNA